MTNLKTAAAIIKAAEKFDVKAMEQLLSPNFIGHWDSTKVKKADALKGLAQEKVANHNPAHKVEIIRQFADGDFVVLHMRSTHNANHKNYVMLELMRYENGQLADSWIGTTEEVAKTASGHSQIDGETKVTDHEATSENKKIVRSFIEDVLVKSKPKDAAKYLGDKYIQHNTLGKDGLAETIKLFTDLEAHGKKVAFKKVHHLVGEGNFVFAHSEGLIGSDKFFFYDLFRVEKGKIVEHWDVIEPVVEAKK